MKKLITFISLTLLLSACTSNSSDVTVDQIRAQLELNSCNLKTEIRLKNRFLGHQNHGYDVDGPLRMTEASIRELEAKKRLLSEQLNTLLK